MKKILLLLTCLLIGCQISGCSGNNASFEKRDYRIDGNQVEQVILDVSDRKIEIQRSDDQQVHLSYYESEKEFYDISLSNDKELKMTLDTNKEWIDYFGGKAGTEERTILLSLPDDMIRRLKISTSNEDVKLPALDIEDSIEVYLNQGNLQVEKLQSDFIHLETKNGNLEGSIIGSYDTFSIESDAHKGDNNLPAQKEGGEKKLEAYTNNGNIQLEFVPESE